MLKEPKVNSVDSDAHVHDLEIVARISAAVARILDSEELLQTVVDMVKTSFNLYHAQIYLLDDATSSLVLTAGAGDVGRKLKQRRHSIPLDREHSIVAVCARTHEGVIINNVMESPDFQVNSLLPNTKAEMSIPLVVGDNLVGVLDVQADYINRFTEDDVRVKTVLGNQIAVAIRNARLFQDVHAREAELQTALRQAEALGQINGELARAEDEDRLLKIVMNFVKPYNVSNGRLYHMHTDQDNQPIGIEAFAWYSGDGQAISLSKMPSTYLGIDQFPVLGLVLANTDQPVFIEDAASDPRMQTDVMQLFIDKLDIKSCILLALKTGDDWQGFISLSWTESQDFPSEMREILTGLMPTASSSLASIRAYAAQQAARHESELRVTDLQTVAQVSAAVATVLDPDELLQNVADLVKSAFGLYHAHIYLYDEASASLVLAAGADQAGRTMKARGHSIPFGREHSLVARCARTREGVIVNDVTKAPDFLPNPLLPDTKAEMAIPMVVGDILVGVLDVQANITDRFTPTDVRVKTTLADQIAIAIQNAHAFALIQHGTMELETVAKVNAATASILDLDQLLQTVTDLTKESFGLYHAQIYLLDNVGENLVLAAGAGKVGRTMLERGHSIRLDDQRSQIAKCGRSQEGIITNDVALAPDFLGNPLLPKTKAEMSIPMVLGDVLVGVLDVQASITDRFTQDDVRIKTILANQISVAVQNAHAFTLIQHGTQELEAVAKISAATASILDLDQLLQTVTDLTKESFGLYHAQIYLLDNVKENLVLAAGAGKTGRTMLERGHSIQVNDLYSQIAHCARTREGIISNDVSQVADFRANPLLPNTKAEMSIPMILGDVLVGVLDVQASITNRFTSDDVRVKTTLADQIAVAVQNAHAFTVIQHGTHELEAVAKISAATASILDLDQLLQTVTDLTKESFGLYHAQIYLLDKAEKNLVLAAGAGKVGRTMLERGHSIRLDNNHSQVAHCARTHEGIISNDVSLVAGFVANPLLPDTKAEMSIPMIVGNTLVGVLDVQASITNRFTKDDVRVKTTLADQISVAVQNAHAFTQIQERETDLQTAIKQVQVRATELETVAKVSAIATTTLDPNELLQIAADMVKTNFGLYHAHIYLFDEASSSLVLAAGADEAGRTMKARGHSIPFDREHSLVARCARTREGVIVNDVTKAPDFLPNPLLPDTKAEMAIPMVVGNTLIGVLDVQANITNRFTQDDVRVKTTLADQIAVAVQNASLYQKQVQMVDQLQTVDRLKSEFLASMSHELRTPLNSIIGYSQMLLNGANGELDEETNLDIDAINKGGQHLLSLINDILDLAKIEAGSLELDPEPVDLTEIAETVLQITSILRKDKPIEFVIDADPQLPMLWADPIRLRQILNNLVSNAIKFTSEGEIRIHAKPKDGMAVIGVTDSGMGIAPDQLERIFERFQQADTSSTRKAGGTGLGLTITRHLVDMHHGTVWVESAVGQHTTFWFTIPLNK